MTETRILLLQGKVLCCNMHSYGSRPRGSIICVFVYLVQGCCVVVTRTCGMVALAGSSGAVTQF